MPQQTAASIINNVYTQLTPGDTINFAFQGGEPLLAGLEFFRYFTKIAKTAAPKGVKTNYSIQTNGLIINEDWCCLFKEHKFLVGLSMDGYAALHNNNRLDRHGKGTFNRVMVVKNLLARFDVPFNILCVLTAEAARRASKIWGFVMDEKISHIQFIPCLEPLDLGATPHSLTSKKFAQFYTTLFPLWQKEAEKGNIIHVRLFDDLASIYFTGQGATCGISGRCSPQIIVEADGTVYPCDFYCLDQHKVSNLETNSIKDVFEAVVASGFMQNRPGIPPTCANCSYVKWCQGGCKRMAHAVYGENCGMKVFLDRHLQSLIETTRKLIPR